MKQLAKFSSQSHVVHILYNNAEPYYAGQGESVDPTENSSCFAEA